jgi:hypothetical protein
MRFELEPDNFNQPDEVLLGGVARLGPFLSLRRATASESSEKQCCGESDPVCTASPRTPKQWHFQRWGEIAQSVQFPTRSPGIRSKCLRLRVTRVA